MLQNKFVKFYICTIAAVVGVLISTNVMASGPLDSNEEITSRIDKLLDQKLYLPLLFGNNDDATTEAPLAPECLDEEWITYQDPVYGFSVDYPPCWAAAVTLENYDETAEEIVIDQRVAFRNSQEPKFTVDVWHNDSDKTLMTWFETYQLPMLLGENDVVPTEPNANIAGETAIFSAEYYENDRGATFTFILAHGEYIYSFEYYVLDYGDSLATYERMVRSFRFGESLSRGTDIVPEFPELPNRPLQAQEESCCGLSSPGNAYPCDGGNCTWYARYKRPDTGGTYGSFWGNAHSWDNRAVRDGFNVTANPTVGAIAVSNKGEYGHVAYVEGFNSSTVNVSEMNWNKRYTDCEGYRGPRTKTYNRSFFQSYILSKTPPPPPVSSDGITTIIEEPTLHQPYNNDVCSSYWYAWPNNRGHTAYVTLNTNEVSHNSAEWKPNNLQLGTYAIYAYIFDHGGSFTWPCSSQRSIYGDTEDARYNIEYNGTSITVSRNQLPVTNDWLYIGTFENPTKVSLSDLNGQEKWIRSVSFSAMKFVRVDKKITGRVLEQGTNKPIVGATVSTDKGQTATTDVNGYYEIFVSEGTYDVTARKDGYRILNSPRSGVSFGYNDLEKKVGFYGVLIPPPPLPQPVVLVHGIQLLGSPSDDKHKCSTGITKYSELNTFDDMAGWFANEEENGKKKYSVWIAHLDTSAAHTPSIEQNSECLKQQIESVYRQTGQKVILVAHSMGGIVSRACIGKLGCGDKVKRFYTLGSPHAGLNWSFLIKLFMYYQAFQGNAGAAGAVVTTCTWQTAGCDMTADEMLIFNARYPNKTSLGKYTFIAGDNTPSLWGLGWLLRVTEGKHDGFIGAKSALGWIHPSKQSIPSWWTNHPHFAGYETDEVHIELFADNRAYTDHKNGDKSEAYQCIEKVESNKKCPNKARSRELDGLQTEIDLSETTINFSGLITAHQLVTYTVPVDSSGHSVFILTASEGTPSLQLIQPDGQAIDPSNQNVTYDVVSEENELLPPMATYTISQTQPGTWTVGISVAGLGVDPASFTTFVALESSRKMTFASDKKAYQIGDTAKFTVTIQDGARGVVGTDVSVLLSRFDNVTETLTFVEQGNGVYTIDYRIPNAPGYLQLRIFGEGVDQGIEFNRQIDTLLTILSPSAQLEDRYRDYGSDADGNGLYEYLVLESSINATKAGTYTIHANLVVSDTVIASTSIYTVLQSGVQTVSLPFDGKDIYLNELDGPYNVSNLSVTDIENGGVTTVNANNVWTTQYYDWRDFGYLGTSAIAIFQDTVIEHDNWFYDGDLGAFSLATGEVTTYEGLLAGSYTIYQDPTSFPPEEIVLLTVSCKDIYGRSVEVQIDRDNFETTIEVEDDQFLICHFVNEEADVSND